MNEEGDEDASRSGSPCMCSHEPKKVLPAKSPLHLDRLTTNLRAEFPRCFPENVDLNFLGFRNPVFSIDTIWNSILEGVFASFV